MTITVTVGNKGKANKPFPANSKAVSLLLFKTRQYFNDLGINAANAQDNLSGSHPIGDFIKRLKAYDGWEFDITNRKMLTLCEQGKAEGATHVFWS